MEQKVYKILIADSLAQEGIDILKQNKNFVVDVNTKHTKDELIKIIPDYDAVIIRSATTLSADVIEAAKKLKVVARAGTGYDNIDAEACSKKGIIVMITPLGNTNAVVELTLGFMLAFARKLVKANCTMSEGKWEKKILEGTELKGKTVGIIGLGRIGAGVAKRCQAFEMNVIGYDKFVPKKYADEIGVKLIENFEDLLKQSDYITIHIPLNEQTENMIDKPQLEKMKKNAVIINVARGGIVNEKALLDALKEKKIGGACFDVFMKEPACKDDTPFIGLDNVITTPHLGASTVEAQIEVAKLAADHITRALLSNIYIDAVNVPFKLSQSQADLYRPYMKLGGALGRFIGQYNSSRITEVTIKHKGEIIKDLEPIKLMILRGIFDKKFDETITLMNIESKLKLNGIQINIEKYTSPVAFEEYLKVYVKTDSGAVTKIAGTVFADQPKIVEIDGIFFDFAPSNYMLAVLNNDKPGVIGRLGTFLGSKNVNIAGFQLGRVEKGNTALSIIAIDDPVNEKDIAELKKMPEILDAHIISL